MAPSGFSQRWVFASLVMYVCAINGTFSLCRSFVFIRLLSLPSSPVSTRAHHLLRCILHWTWTHRRHLRHLGIVKVNAAPSLFLCNHSLGIYCNKPLLQFNSKMHFKLTYFPPNSLLWIYVFSSDAVYKKMLARPLRFASLIGLY